MFFQAEEQDHLIKKLENGCNNYTNIYGNPVYEAETQCIQFLNLNIWFEHLLFIDTAWTAADSFL